jgi:hypothetical protein
MASPIGSRVPWKAAAVDSLTAEDDDQQQDNRKGGAPVFGLTRLSALGQHRFVFPEVGPTSPSGGIDGLLGLDFRRDQVLRVDFRSEPITLA